MRNDNILLDCIISQEMVSHVYVFSSRMLTRVVRYLDDTLIVTQQGDLVHNVTIVLKSLSYLKELSTTTIGCDILFFGHG
jgi:hypothetical protein